MEDNNNKVKHSAPSYKVIRLLGEGSYGKAYLVTRNIDQEILVLKSIKIENMSKKEQDEAVQEARILERMDHSNIIKIHDCFRIHRPYEQLNIITEYADGGDLGQKIKAQPKSKPFSEDQILDYFTQICLAIKHIHNKQIIHRDLKSPNIFLTKSGLVKLGDFGIAKVLNCTLEKAMTMIGTPYYLSPEIVRGKPYSYKSDIWSLGVLLFEMMALKMPFDANSLPILSLKIMKGNYPPPPFFYSKELRSLVMSMLHVNEDKRPSASDILRLPFIKSRIMTFLNEVEYNREFTRTVIKSYVSKKNQIQIHKNTPSPHRINIKHSNSNDNNQKDYKTPFNNIMISNQKKKDIKAEKNQQRKQIEPNQPHQLHQYRHNQPGQNLNVYKPHINHQQQVSVIRKIKMKKESSKDNSNQDIINNNIIKKQKSQESSSSSNNNIINDSKAKINYPSTSIKITASNDLKNFILKSREEMKKKMQNEEVIWPEKNPIFPSSSNEVKQTPNDDKQTPFPKIIILDKPQSNPSSSKELTSIPEDPKQKEDEYNANRYLEQLNQIAIEEYDSDEDNDLDVKKQKKQSLKEEKESTNDEQEFHLDSITNQNTKVDESKEPQTPNSNDEKKEFNSDYITDYSQIEEMKMYLEGCLGVELFKTIYHCVDSCTNPKEYLFDTDKISEQLKKELIEKKYSQRQIDLSLDKIPEVISIVIKDRTSNISLSYLSN